ncbi:hypothetical protein NDU88_007115, partial [Pleurodeles waltl]
AQGYAIHLWVMTPYVNPQSDSEKAYNMVHVHIRNVVERTFGMLKARIQCLDVSGWRLLYSPQLVCKINVVCAILHNFCVRTNVPWEEQVKDEDNDDPPQDGDGPHASA